MREHRGHHSDSSGMDANTVYMFVGRVSTKIEVRHAFHDLDNELAELNELRLNITPLCMSAGYKKHLTIPPTEESGIPILSISDRTTYYLDSETGEFVMETIPAPDYGLEEGKRYLFFVRGSGAAANPIVP